MTNQEIFEIAKKVDFELCPNGGIAWDGIDCTKELLEFAKLIANLQIEKCAKICDYYALKDDYGDWSSTCAEQIILSKYANSNE